MKELRYKIGDIIDKLIYRKSSASKARDEIYNLIRKDLKE